MTTIYITPTLGDTVHVFRFQNPCFIDKHIMKICPLSLSMTTIYITPTLGDSACIPFPESMFYR